MGEGLFPQMQNTQGIKLTTHLPPCAKIKNGWTSNLYISICLLGVFTDNFTLLYFTFDCIIFLTYIISIFKFLQH